MRDLSPAQLSERLAAPEPPLLLDVREPWEYEHCRIEDSVLVPMGTIPAQCSKLDPNRETVVICHHGVRSRQVAHFLERTGFTQVFNLAGGVDAWARDVDVHMKTY